MKLLTYQELCAQPSLEYLVEGILPIGATAMLYGPSGHGKTFVATDLAHSVSAGVPFVEHSTKEGPGLYVIAEGGGGFSQRTVVWCAAKDRAEPGPMRYLREPVRFHDRNHVQELLGALRAAAHTPVIVIVDTLAASVSGGNEDKSADMLELIDGVKTLQRETGCAAVLVHHTGWDESRERGSSSLRAAMDVVMGLRRIGSGVMELKVEKMRDAEKPASIFLKLRKVATESGLKSAVPERLAMAFEQVHPNLGAVLSALAGQSPLTDSAWKTGSGLPRTTFYREKRNAVTRDFVVEVDNRFQLTATGKDALAQSHGTSWDSHGTRAEVVPKVPIRKDGTMGLSRNDENGTGSVGTVEVISDEEGLAIYAQQHSARGAA